MAHQKDDLIETYLMQKERKLGVSYYGLRQSNTIKGVKVFRPLLSYTKKDLIRTIVMTIRSAMASMNQMRVTIIHAIRSVIIRSTR